MGRVRIKRIYQEADPSDGVRVLVDRVWPRGFTKERARVDHWMKALGPSAELRKWFAHDPARWDAFRERYFAELAEAQEVEPLRRLVRGGVVTLVYSARDEEQNQAVVLREFLES